jgi:hypothetical protein
LADAGINPSIGTAGDSYPSHVCKYALPAALSDSIIGLFKTGVTKLLGPWKSMGQLERETLSGKPGAVQSDLNRLEITILHDSLDFGWN